MSEIALYNALVKLGLKHDEAKEAVTDVANSKEVATKEYIKAEIANLETRLTNRIYAVAGVIIAAVGLMLAVTGLMIRFFMV